MAGYFGQFSMVNLELFNIVEDIKKVSKAFVVHPKNVNAENATILPVMLSSKLLPEMEMDDNYKREQLLHGMQNLQLASQIKKLKTRIDMIGAACESAEKVIADTRKAYFGTRQGPTVLPTSDKVQAAKIQEQENLLRNAVNHGEGEFQIGGNIKPLDPKTVASVIQYGRLSLLLVHEAKGDSLIYNQLYSFYCITDNLVETRKYNFMIFKSCYVVEFYRTCFISLNIYLSPNLYICFSGIFEIFFYLLMSCHTLKIKMFVETVELCVLPPK